MRDRRIVEQDSCLCTDVQLTSRWRIGPNGSPAARDPPHHRSGLGAAVAAVRAIYVPVWSSVPPEQLLRAPLLQVLYTIRSERQLIEQLDYNLLFRWFVGLGIDGAVWLPTTFSKNRDRLLDGDIAAAFFEAVRLHVQTARLLSDEHFTVDGALLAAWASHKSLTPRDTPPPDAPGSGDNAAVDFRGQRRRPSTLATRLTGANRNGFPWVHRVLSPSISDKDPSRPRAMAFPGAQKTRKTPELEASARGRRAA
jgi:Transposase domain (DUF772)